jgi:uncharacterized protein (TIRG00374 family)
MNDNPPKKTWAKLVSSPIFRVTIGLLLSGLSLYLAVRNVDFREARTAIAEADFLLVGLALCSVGLNLFLKALRWNVLLGLPGKVVPFSKVGMSFLTGQMLNSILPARIGDLSRVFVVGGMGPGHAFVLGTVAIEKVLDMLSYAVLFFVLIFSIQLPDWMGRSGYAFAVFTFVLFVIILVVTFRREWVINLLKRIILLFPQRIEKFLNKHIVAGLSSLDILQNRTDVLKLAFLTALIWGTAILNNYIVLLAFDIQLPWVVPLMLLIALQAGITIPSLPGSIGIFEFICVLTLGYFGIDDATALSYGILLHVIVYLPVIAGGLISFWMLQLGQSHVSQLQAARSSK